jgi:hypothetical protein
VRSHRGLSLPIPSLRERLRTRLGELGLEVEPQVWIPQARGAWPLGAEGAAPEASETVLVSGADAWVATYLDEVQAHWESALASHARQLALAQAVHGLSNALTPLLCAETADTLTTEEQARVTWRSDTLRHLARGAETPSACAAGPFLQNLRRALEHAGVELHLETPAELAERPLAPDHRFLRDRLLEALLAAHQGRGEGPAPTLRLGAEAGSLTLELEAAPGVLFSRRGADLVEVQRDPDQTRLKWTLPRPWLAWLGPPPASTAALDQAGLGLLVIPTLAEWEAAMANRPRDFAEGPIGLALGGPRAEHGHLKRALLSRDLGLARACHSAANWPPCRIPEVVDVAAWCRAQAKVAT